MTNKVRAFFLTLGRPLVALVFALVAGGVVIGLVEKKASAPFAAYAALVSGAMGSTTGWAATLAQTTPLLLTGASVAVALAAGLFNIGAQGQFAIGGLATAVCSAALPQLPPVLNLALSLAVGMLAGAAWAYLPALLKVKRGTHEVITAILLNYIAQNVTRYLATYPLKDPSGQAPQTREVAAVLPRLFNLDVHAGLIVGMVTVVLLAAALSRTVWGFETRAVGLGPGASEANGIAVGRTQINAFLLAGAISGLAGAVTVLGAVPFHRFTADLYDVGYGFDGLAVALLAGGNLWAVIPSALLFGILGAGAEAMSFNTDTPRQIVQVVQALLIVAVAARFIIRRRAKRFGTGTRTSPGGQGAKA